MINIWKVITGLISVGGSIIIFLFAFGEMMHSNKRVEWSAVFWVFLFFVYLISVVVFAILTGLVESMDYIDKKNNGKIDREKKKLEKIKIENDILRQLVEEKELKKQLEQQFRDSSNPTTFKTRLSNFPH